MKNCSECDREITAEEYLRLGGVCWECYSKENPPEASRMKRITEAVVKALLTFLVVFIGFLLVISDPPENNNSHRPEGK